MTPKTLSANAEPSQAVPERTANARENSGVEQFFDGRVTLLPGDCLDRLKDIADSSVDAIVTDPPYGLEFMGKGWDDADGFRRSLNRADAERDSVFGRTSRKAPEYRAGNLYQEFMHAVAIKCLRVLKPGGHLLMFGGTRTYHRMACAIEDAGFQIRDSIQWLYGSGFPKSLDVSKAIDKAAGEERERIRGVRSGVVADVCAQDAWSKEFKDSVLSSEPITDTARQWDGWGTVLKPACEPIVLARKPLDSSPRRITITPEVLATWEERRCAHA